MNSFYDKNIIGLTGMSGAGKTTVSEIFAENGFEVINCDRLARRVMEKGKPCLSETAEKFGKAVFAPDGNLDRVKMAELVFSDEKRRLEYNSVIYPYISYELIEMIGKSAGKNVLIDAPTLFESGIDKICRKIVSVVSDKSARRIMERDGISGEMAQKRLSSQHGKAFYIGKSDFCIENNGTLGELKSSVQAVVKELECLL